MSLRDSLFGLAGAYCAHTGLSRARLATLVANDGKFFGRVESGGGFTARTYEHFVQWFSDHWPSDLPWPDGIDRPSRSPSTVQSSEAA